MTDITVRRSYSLYSFYLFFCLTLHLRCARSHSTKDGNTAAARWTETRGTTDRVMLNTSTPDSFFSHLPCSRLLLLSNLPSLQPPSRQTHGSSDNRGGTMQPWRTMEMVGRKLREQRRLTGKLSSEGGTFTLLPLLSSPLPPLLPH